MLNLSNKPSYTPGVMINLGSREMVEKWRPPYTKVSHNTDRLHSQTDAKQHHCALVQGFVTHFVGNNLLSPFGSTHHCTACPRVAPLPSRASRQFSTSDLIGLILPLLLLSFYAPFGTWRLFLAVCSSKAMMDTIVRATRPKRQSVFHLGISKMKRVLAYWSSTLGS